MNQYIGDNLSMEGDWSDRRYTIQISVYFRRESGSLIERLSENM